ncbi:acyltransferase [Chitinimonas koreensis]|uniref:acyltransferase n=1 Tax=Chitinimonas koreensis TaxID=356302 RepID=UPI00040C0C9A|nr:acyltransferase [Chitinimonas koreensis]QNM98063.1 N-acetyltransferase [Chitinimonas koreensis]
MSNFFVHATAEVSDKAVIGEGTKIWNLAQVRERAQIGANCIVSKNVYIDFDVKIGSRVKVQNNVSVYNGVTIEDDVFVGPAVTFTNDFRPRAVNPNWKVTETLIRRGASLGANCTIVCGHTIGEYAMIAAGAVVACDVPDHALMVGNPARAIGYVYKDGNRVLPQHFRGMSAEGGLIFGNPENDEALTLPAGSVRLAAHIG